MSSDATAPGYAQVLPGEIDTIGVNLASELVSDEVLTGTPTVTIVLSRGPADAPSPEFGDANVNAEAGEINIGGGIREPVAASMGVFWLCTVPADAVPSLWEVNVSSPKTGSKVARGRMYLEVI